MVTELVIERWCDMCFERGIKSASRALIIGDSPRSAKEVDLCDECRHTRYMDEVAQWASEHGRKPDQEEKSAPAAAKDDADAARRAKDRERKARDRHASATDPARRTYCLICWRSFGGNTGNASAHYAEVHGAGRRISVTEFIGTSTCPECGVVLADSMGLAQHAKRGHGKSITYMIKEAHDAGTDPHGIISGLRTMEQILAAPEGAYASQRVKTLRSRRAEQKDES